MNNDHKTNKLSTKNAEDYNISFKTLKHIHLLFESLSKTLLHCINTTLELVHIENLRHTRFGLRLSSKFKLFFGNYTQDPCS